MSHNKFSFTAACTSRSSSSAAAPAGQGCLELRLRVARPKKMMSSARLLVSTTTHCNRLNQCGVEDGESELGDAVTLCKSLPLSLSLVAVVEEIVHLSQLGVHCLQLRAALCSVAHDERGAVHYIAYRNNARVDAFSRAVTPNFTPAIVAAPSLQNPAMRCTSNPNAVMTPNRTTVMASAVVANSFTQVKYSVVATSVSGCRYLT